MPHLLNALWDEDFFFGRETLVAGLQQRRLSSSCACRVRPCGSGKSSLAIRGLIPSLREHRPGLQVVNLLGVRGDLLCLYAAATAVGSR